MTAKALDLNESQESEKSQYQSTALLIGNEEFININISNRLHDQFRFSVISKDILSQGIDFLTASNVSLVVLDIDKVDFDGLARLYKIVNHLQIPCLFISNDPAMLNTLRQEMDNTFISFLPKGILNTMFNDTLKLLLKKTNPATKMSRRFIEVSTLEKPISLYLLAMGLFLEPIIKILYLKIQTGFEWDILFRTIFSIDSALGNFEFWALFPLAGYALISVRSWSFFFFIGLQVYSLYTYFTYEKFTWPYVAETPHISTGLLLMFNFALVLYFIVPANRRPYWNKTRRLWRNTSRYATNLQTKFKSNGNTIPTTITNISETGAYFTTSQNMPVGHTMQIELPINGEIRNLEAIIRRTQPTAHDNYHGYGVEFTYKSKEEKHEIKEYINSLNHRIQ